MFAATFPGQGSQSVGMLADLAGVCPEVRGTFEEASHALRYDLWKLVREGPEARLATTERTQPAMLAAGVAAWRCWVARGGSLPGIAAGHSLGEYSALAAFGAFDFEDAVRAVAARGRFMQEAVPEGEGGIAAVIGLDDDTVVDLCAGISAEPHSGHVSAVNFNAPGQVAVAGTSRAIDAVIEAAVASGARRAIRLPMSVPVHCRLMEPAVRRLEAELAGVEVVLPSVPVLQNADNAVRANGESIRRALVSQLASPVRWRQSVARMRERGAAAFVEFGPGRVLTGLARRIDRGIPALAVHDEKSLDAALDTLDVLSRVDLHS